MKVAARLPSDGPVEGTPDSPRPIIRLLAERGEMTARQLREAGAPRVTHWLNKLEGDGAVRPVYRRGRVYWWLTYAPTGR